MSIAYNALDMIIPAVVSSQQGPDCCCHNYPVLSSIHLRILLIFKINNLHKSGTALAKLSLSKEENP
jgi:hypothetical protein